MPTSKIIPRIRPNRSVQINDAISQTQLFDESGRFSARNAVVAFLSALVILAFVVVRTWAFNTYLGLGLTGIWSIVGTILPFLNILEAGAASAAVFFLYKPISERDWQKCSRVLAAGKRYYRIIGFLYLGIIFLIALATPFVTDTTDVWWAVSGFILISGLETSVLYFVSSEVYMGLEGQRRGYVSVVANLIATSATNATAIILVCLSSQIGVLTKEHYLVLISALLGLAPLGTTLFRFLKRRALLPWFEKTPYVSNKPMLDSLKILLIHKASTLVLFNADLVIILLFRISDSSSFATAGIYGSYALIADGTRVIFSSIIAATTSSFGHLLSNNERLDNEAFAKVELAGSVFAGLAFVIATWWTPIGGALLGSGYFPLYGLLLSLPILFYMVRMPSTMIIDAKGHWRETMWRAVAEAVINVAFSVGFVFLLKHYGWFTETNGQKQTLHGYLIVGLTLGTCVAFLYRTIDAMIYVRLKVLRKVDLREIFTRLAICLVPAAVSSLLYGFFMIGDNRVDWQTWSIQSSGSIPDIYFHGSFVDNFAVGVDRLGTAFVLAGYVLGIPALAFVFYVSVAFIFEKKQSKEMFRAITKKIRRAVRKRAMKRNAVR